MPRVHRSEPKDSGKPGKGDHGVPDKGSHKVGKKWEQNDPNRAKPKGQAPRHKKGK
jgi:hypothetical protein